jgi:hypothetical protein
MSGKSLAWVMPARLVPWAAFPPWRRPVPLRAPSGNLAAPCPPDRGASSGRRVGSAARRGQPPARAPPKTGMLASFRKGAISWLPPTGCHQPAAELANRVRCGRYRTRGFPLPLFGKRFPSVS